MKYILSESQFKLLVEQTNNSAANCDTNISKEAGYGNFWKSLDPNKRNELLNSLNNIVSQSLDKSRNTYIKWFQNPLTIKKFKTPQEQEVLKKLPEYLKSIRKANYAFSGPKNSSGARAWVSQDKPTVINYNLSQIHNGNDFVGMSIDDTTKHEMGHLIDYFFKNNGVDTYLQTINTDDASSYNANYLVNDSDQYTRLNVLRGIINAGPQDPPLTLLNKFLNQVKSGKITSDKFNFSGLSSKNPGLTQKNNMQAATEVFKVLQQSIFVDGKNNHNVEQLFSNFGILKNGIVYVSFDLISQLNITSKDLEKKYYFLKMSPK